MYQIASPTGTTAAIPAVREEDFAYFTPGEATAAAAYYREFGYVVIRGLVPRAQCVAAMAAFNAEVRPHGGYIYRQTTGNPERHVLTGHGYVLNPVLNVQDFPRHRFPAFRSTTLDVVTGSDVQAAVTALIGKPPVLVQSMYFEGNSATWAHQDTYYLDSENLGTMAGGWFALEDIAPGAGRFYVYPGSHRIDMTKNGGDFDIAFNHDRYKTLIIDVIRRHDLECRAPALQQGDVLFWNGRTIHGSLPTTQPERSRSSLTAHYIPAGDRFLQFQSRFKPLRLERHNGMAIHCPKSLDRALNRAILFVETTFPGAFRLAKRLAIKIVTR